MYLTYPFVLSWSLLEAMSCGCAVVGSNTAPVKEVIEHRQNGLFVDFFDPQQIAEAIAAVLAEQQGNSPTRLGQAARKTILQRFAWPGLCGTPTGINGPGGQRIDRHMITPLPQLNA